MASSPLINMSYENCQKISRSDFSRKGKVYSSILLNLIVEQSFHIVNQSL